MSDVIDSRQLLAFVTLLEMGSFTAAAREMGLTQSAVTHSIHALERDLGCRLLDRLGKRITATQAGEALQQHALTVLSTMRRARLELTHLGQWGNGRLRVAATATVCQHIIPAVIREFRESFPNWNIQIEPLDTPDGISALRERRVDICVGLEPDPQPDLTFRKHASDELSFIVHPLHPWAGTGAAEPGQIATQSYILYGKRSLTAGIVTRYFAAQGITLKSMIELANTQAILELVALGLGVGILAGWVIQESLTRGILKSIPLGRKKLRRSWGCTILKGRRLSLAEETFCGLCKASWEQVFESR
jgi:DNA-binding transcriptional LysR family regulator